MRARHSSSPTCGERAGSRRADASGASGLGTLEILIEGTAIAADGSMPGPVRCRERGEAVVVSHRMSMPWADLLRLLTDDRLTVLRQLRTNPSYAPVCARTAALEWAGLLGYDANGRPSVPYREIVVRIPL